MISAPSGLLRTVFISYSHKDVRWLERLQVHLRPLEHRGLVERWDDTRIQAGQAWRQEIESSLMRASIAVLMISADFLASEFIAQNELPPLLDSAADQGTLILPIILKGCAFTRNESLSRFQAINDPRRPIAELPAAKREAIFDKIAALIEERITANRSDLIPATRYRSSMERPEVIKELSYEQKKQHQDDQVDLNFTFSLNKEECITIDIQIGNEQQHHLIYVASDEKNNEYYEHLGDKIYYLIHEAGYHRPLIFDHLECNGYKIMTGDFDRDGIEELAVEYYIAAHTHVLHIYRIPRYGGRPSLILGGRIGAEGGVIAWCDRDGDGVPEIYALQNVYYFINDLDDETRGKIDRDEGGFWDVYKFVDENIIQIEDRKFIEGFFPAGTRQFK